MKPLVVEFQAFGPYAGYEKVDFSDISSKGLFLICGKTGTGKTMILDAMTFALFGKSSGNGRDDFAAMRCTKAEDDVDTFVKFEFENNGEFYIFERRLTKKRTKFSESYSALKKESDGKYYPMFENAKGKLLNDKAEEIIGLDYSQFVQVIILPQGKFEKLLTSNSDDKEKILTSIFGEDRWQVIADTLYEQVNTRKEELKTLKERLESSLKEEQCTTISELEILIGSKKEEVERLSQEYNQAGYEAVQKQQQEKLAIAKRFTDMENVAASIKQYEADAGAISELESKEKDAKRAQLVKEHLSDVDKAKENLAKRIKDEADLKALEMDAREELATAEKEYEEHILLAGEIEDKKKLKIQYEGKRAAYESMDLTEKEVQNREQEKKYALDDEDAARKICDEDKEKVSSATKEYEKLNSEHDGLLRGYIAGITGELAQNLEEGMACPVCGSTHHPSKAQKLDDSISKTMVDEKKEQVDIKYTQLQKQLSKQKDSMAAFEQAQSRREKANAEYIVATERLNSLKKDLVKGINSLKQLNDEIKKLSTEIDAYAVKTQALEGRLSELKDKSLQLTTKVSSAGNEVVAAEKECEDKEKSLLKALSENGFTDESQVRNMLLSDEELQALRKKISDHEAGLKAAKDLYNKLNEELKGKERPDTEECDLIIANAQKAIKEHFSIVSVINSEIDRLSEKLSKIKSESEGMEEKIRICDEDYAFAKKLRGDSGTGLQRYVLGIMFSSVVQAANKMLEMVHGGRYRLFRTDEKAQGSNKRGLELKVYDRNSLEHDGRFVNTLSGGEKFLASLALSIGMSTVASKSGIKIDALFIDEGFGSLDEDSIGDAMNILNSIQEANGLVGIISHVQLLQDRIPTKLMVCESEKGSHIVRSIG